MLMIFYIGMAKYKTIMNLYKISVKTRNSKEIGLKNVSMDSIIRSDWGIE